MVIRRLDTTRVKIYKVIIQYFINQNISTMDTTRGMLAVMSGRYDICLMFIGYSELDFKILCLNYGSTLKTVLIKI